ncbi:hypothetical protein Tco_0118883, partial [Tanacetum coccineum]
MFSTMANASRSLDKSDMIIPVVGPSQAPDSSIHFPGIKRMSWHHKSDKSKDIADVILGGYVMACVVA